MTKPILYLFPDTNLFIQCRWLDQLHWDELGDFAEIRLVVCRTVQREIDDQKYRGRSRIAKRALKAYSLFGNIMSNKTGYQLVNQDPPVKLILQGNGLLDPEMSNVLDYGKPDDEIVGYCYGFCKDNPGQDVRLLTHDIGAMLSAENVGLPYVQIRNEWLLPPEHDESEKEIARLRSELIRLKKAEPQFMIKCVDENLEEVSSLDFMHKIYQPLSNEEVSDFLDVLKNNFPLDTGFKTKPQTYGEIFGELKYVPPSKAAISKYKNEKYPDWLDTCESSLLNLHETLQAEELPYFCFLAQNSGIQPARDALVVVSAKGNFRIRPPEYVGENDQEHEGIALQLPLPPEKPKGRLVRNVRTALQSYSQNFDIRSDHMPLVMPDLSHLTSNPRRDPNAFYYKPYRPEEPVEAFSFECEQWRHATKPEPFRGNIFVESNRTEVKGALEFEIHAENLPEPLKSMISIRIDLKHVSTRPFAQKLIDGLQLAPHSGT